MQLFLSPGLLDTFGEIFFFPKGKRSRALAV